MSKNNLIYNVEILDGKFVYSSPEWRKKIEEFKKLNEQRNIKISIEVIDKPEFHMFKWYWGYLLPDIALAMGERNIHYVHIILKRDFVYLDCDELDQIPSKYCKKGIYPVNINKLFSLKSDDYPFSMIKGVIIVYDNEKNINGYICSNSDLSYDEMKDYILKCENRLFVDLAGHIQEKHSKIAKYHREQAFKK